MEITTVAHKRCTVLKAVGRIDSSTAGNLEQSFKEIMDAGQHNIIFDMKDVSFISSRGLGVLISAQKACKGRGDVALVGMSPDIRKSLDLVGMGDYFKIYDDLTAAVGSF